MDLRQVADELYGLPPPQFRVTRDERVAEARATGDRKLAVAIGKLRRPTVSAWLVNQLARKAGGDLDRLLELGGELRGAQQALAGDRLRELSSRRRSQVTALVRQAKRLAGEAGLAMGAQLEREVAATLEAALADPDAAEAVRSGHLTSPLFHVGLGGMGPELAVTPGESARPGRHLRVVPDAPARDGAPGRQAAQAAKPARRAATTTRQTTVAGRTAAREEREAEQRAQQAAREAAREAAAAQRRAREAAAAERDVHDAEELAAQASATLEEAEQRVTGARARRDSLRRELAQLEERLAVVEADEVRAAREVRVAQQDRESAARSLATAQRRAVRARAALDKLRTP